MNEILAKNSCIMNQVELELYYNKLLHRRTVKEEEFLFDYDLVNYFVIHLFGIDGID